MQVIFIAENTGEFLWTSGVEKWLEFVKESCRHDQYITTLKGRRRYLPEINDSDWATRSHAERQAINSICQGSAADLVKVAMIKLQDALPEGAVMILQVMYAIIILCARHTDHQLTYINASQHSIVINYTERFAQYMLIGWISSGMSIGASRKQQYL